MSAIKKYFQIINSNSISRQVLVVLMSITLMVNGACTKDTTQAEIDLSYRLLSDKIWYLDYSITGTSSTSYIGQSTYFISFLKNYTTSDSDGYTGDYSIKKVDGALQIHVIAKSTSNNTFPYVYTIKLVGAKSLILTYTINKITTELYYSSKY